MSKNYTIDAKTNPNLIYGGIFMVFVNAIYLFSGNKISDFEAVYGDIPVEKVAFNLVFFVIQISCTIWSIVVAGRLNRSQVFWGIVTFFFTPIAMIVLGTRDLKMEPELRKIYNKHKTNYFLETIKLKKDLERGIVEENEYKATLAKAKERHRDLMNAELKKMEEVLEDRHRQIIVETVEGGGVAIGIKDKCPACDTKISENDDVCPECELALK